MATYTPNYGLHQWAPEDLFVRTDFNTDFQKIDGALKGIADDTGEVDIMAQRALNALEPLAYNTWSMALRHQYDGTLPKNLRGMLLDCFPNDSGIAQLSTSVKAAEHAVTLYAKGVGDRIQNYGTSTWICPSRDTDSWIQQGRSQATAVKLRISGGDNYAKPKLRVTLSGNKQSVQAELQFSYQSVTEVTLTFNAPLILEGGISYSLTVESLNSYSFNVYTSASGDLGYHLLCTALDVPTGTMKSSTIETRTTGYKALAWVRYDRGVVGISLNGASMTQTGTRTAKSQEGHTCREAAFVLETQLSTAISAMISLDAQDQDSVTVYEYGVVVL